MGPNEIPEKVMDPNLHVMPGLQTKIKFISNGKYMTRWLGFDLHVHIYQVLNYILNTFFYSQKKKKKYFFLDQQFHLKQYTTMHGKK